MTTSYAISSGRPSLNGTNTTTIPAAVFADKRAAAIDFREIGGGVEHEPKRGHVRAKCINRERWLSPPGPGAAGAPADRHAVRWSRNTLRTFGTSSTLVSRNRVIRLGLLLPVFPPDVAIHSTQCITMLLGRVTGSVPAAFDSTTRTSPLKDADRARMLQPGRQRPRSSVPARPRASHPASSRRFSRHASAG